MNVRSQMVEAKLRSFEITNAPDAPCFRQQHKEYLYSKEQQQRRLPDLHNVRKKFSLQGYYLKQTYTNIKASIRFKCATLPPRQMLCN